MWPAFLAAAPGLLSAGKGLFDMFSHHKNPANSAINELNKTPEQVRPYYQPYIDAGKGLPDELRNRYKDMLDDPNKLYNQLASGYKQSPGYANTLREALGGVSNATAAGGMLGTPQHQKDAAQVAGDVADKDFETYLKHMFGINERGLKGEEGINDKAYGANTDYANILANLNQQKAQYQYAGQTGKNQQNAANWANIFGGGANAFQGYNDYNDNQAFQEWLKSNMGGGH